MLDLRLELLGVGAESAGLGVCTLRLQVRGLRFGLGVWYEGLGIGNGVVHS